ncbi:MAG: hypothetical protein EHM36_04280, partial [Deltaproteobacteria bacterium]
MEASFKERLRYEIVGILLVALGVFVFLSLISSSPLDPSFFSYTSSRAKGVQNWMGVVGAYLSSLFFQGFGFPSFLIPFVIGIFAFSFIFRWEWRYLSLKLGGWLVILLAASSLLGLWLRPFPVYQQDLLPGGFIGEFISRAFVRYFNRPGASILLLLLLVIAFVLGTGISFISLVRWLGDGASRLAGKIGTLRMVRKEQAKRVKKLVEQEKETGRA